MKSPILRHAVFGGGCFWCMEAVFDRVPGVVEVEAGYAGGTAENPTYEEVCTGTTGHAEVVRIGYNPAVLEYEGLLATFWRAHDPTTHDRQGADVGSQYRSIILAADDEQFRAAEASREAARELFPLPIVTEIKKLETFNRAENHHQDYFEKHPYAGYCRVVIAPKLEKMGIL
jgi:peptide-methionine (S)-S-oxide reductase